MSPRRWPRAGGFPLASDWTGPKWLPGRRRRGGRQNQTCAGPPDWPGGCCRFPPTTSPARRPVREQNLSRVSFGRGKLNPIRPRHQSKLAAKWYEDMGHRLTQINSAWWWGCPIGAIGASFHFGAIYFNLLQFGQTCGQSGPFLLTPFGGDRRMRIFHFGAIWPEQAGIKAKAEG